MPDLSFEVQSAEPVPFAVAPLLAFKLRVVNAIPAETVHTVALRCQIQIEVTRRGYSPRERERLLDLFGEPARWGDTLRNMLWNHLSAVVPAFSGSTVIDLHAPCTFDFNVAATKYFDGLETGGVPLCLMFSGTVFYAAGDGALQVAPISWEKEARFRLPVSVWKEMMDLYYPNSAWLCLRRDVFEQFYSSKVRRGIPTWEGALESILSTSEEAVSR